MKKPKYGQTSSFSWENNTQGNALKMQVERYLRLKDESLSSYIRRLLRRDRQNRHNLLNRKVGA